MNFKGPADFGRPFFLAPAILDLVQSNDLPVLKCFNAHPLLNCPMRPFLSAITI
jgi:hypothetical protein